MRATLALLFGATLTAWACDDRPARSTAVDDQFDQEEEGSLDAPESGGDKADRAAGNRTRRYRPEGHIDFGHPIAVVDGDVVSSQRAWRFYAREGATLEIRAEGSTHIAIAGPKPRGRDWPAATHHSEPDRADLSATLDVAGLYAIVVDDPAAGHEIRLDCADDDCALRPWARPDPPDALSLMAVGDLGLTVSQAPLDSEGDAKYGEFHYWHEMLEAFAPFVDADVNLANLETAVTTGGDRVEKTYVFRMPADALHEVIDVGFNLFSVANNHAGDYGNAGLADSLGALKDARGDAEADGRWLAWAGVGATLDEAGAPSRIEVRGVRIAHASIGIGWDVRHHTLGIAHVRDANVVIDRLAATDADLRVLSVHGGIERAIEPEALITGIAHRAADAGIELVHGHHPHVVQGIERRGKGIILYSLGNFELRGARNMASLGLDRDFGAAVRLAWDREEHRFTQVEVAPLYDMHRVVYALPADDAAERIRRMNRLSANFGARGVELTIDEGTGHGWARLDPLD